MPRRLLALSVALALLAPGLLAATSCAFLGDATETVRQHPEIPKLAVQYGVLKLVEQTNVTPAQVDAAVSAVEAELTGDGTDVAVDVSQLASVIPFDRLSPADALAAKNLADFVFAAARDLGAKDGTLTPQDVHAVAGWVREALAFAGYMRPDAG